MHDEIALGSNQHRAQAAHRFRSRHTIANHFVGAGIESRRQRFAALGCQDGAGNNGSV